MDKVNFQSQEMPRSHTCYGFYNIWVCVVSVTIRPYNHNMSIQASMHLPTFVLLHCIRILIHMTNAPEPKNDQTHTHHCLYFVSCVYLYACICCIPAYPGESVDCQSSPVMSHRVLSLTLSTYLFSFCFSSRALFKCFSGFSVFIKRTELKWMRPIRENLLRTFPARIQRMTNTWPTSKGSRCAKTN